MALSQSDHLGPYEILGLLGTGGMGEVYRARDPRLDRHVAIKVLPEGVSNDPERLRRFEKEARAAGALNHPNILAVHDVGTHDGRPYLVTELLEGDTLRERLTQIALSAEKAVEFAVQIARGLAAAHDRGIVHRDLKPENLFVTKHGLVKILDFGLAKLRGPQAQPKGTGDDEVTASRTTDTGAVIGTAGYMSPEQVRGRAVDHRSDIFSFGAVLYEMLSGQRAFRGDSGVEVLNAILKEEPPDPSEARPLPSSLGRITARCLEKIPDERFQSARDLVFALGEARDDPEIGPSRISLRKAARLARRWRIPWAGGGVLLGFLLAAAWFWTPSRSTEPARPVVRFRLGVQPAEQLGGALEQDIVGLQRPSRTGVALSPDGRRIVFAGGREGTWQLYVRDLEEPEAMPIPGTEGASGPFFSPDGGWVGFWSGEKLSRVPLDGGLPVEVCETPLVFGASWGANDIIAFGQETGGLLQVSAEGGTPEELTTPREGEIAHRLPHFLPGGGAVLFTVQKRILSWSGAEIVAQIIATGERRTLVELGTDPRYTPSGHLLYARRGTLMAAPFDPARLEITGGAIPLVEGVMQASRAVQTVVDTGAAQFSVSASGSLAYLDGGVYPDVEWPLLWVDRKGRVEPLDVRPWNYAFPRVSPDGRQIAVMVLEMSEEDDSRIWVFDTSRGTLRPTTYGDQDFCPAWAPDGRRLAFSRWSSGSTTDLFWQPTDGSADAERLTTGESLCPSSWSSDGMELAYVEKTVEGETVNTDIWVLPLAEGERRPRPVVKTPFQDESPAFSPDGRWLAFDSNQSGTWEVYVQPYPGPGPRTPVSLGGGVAPAWSGDGSELFFYGNGKMMAVEVETDPVLRLGEPSVLFEYRYAGTNDVRSYDVTPDGQRFLVVDWSKQQSPQPVTHINVVLNWFEELKRRVPMD